MPAACQGVPAQKLVHHSIITNLASSSKSLNRLEVQGFFVFLHIKSDRILLPHFTGKDAVCLLQKLTSPHIFLHL